MTYIDIQLVSDIVRAASAHMDRTGGFEVHDKGARENIVCICPVCHRQVHFGSKTEKEAILKVLYDYQIGSLRKAGLELTYKELLSYYE